MNLTADYVNPDSAAKFAKSIMKGNEHIVAEVAYNGTIFRNWKSVQKF